MTTKPAGSLEVLRDEARSCTECDLYKDATQTVFGEGPKHARLVLVGETPGDSEDKLGHPFVGPAGKLLDTALAEAGIDRSKAYVTNVVKHFKWIPRGKKRLHQKSSAREISACRHWLDAELALIKPKGIVCLGATAAQALLGKKFLVTKQRGELIPSPLAEHVLATVHPSSLLREPDEAARKAAIAQFTADLAKMAEVLGA